MTTRIMTSPRSGRSVFPVMAALAVAFTLGGVQSAEAQTVFGYFPKFVCGFQTGNVPLLNDPNPPINLNSYESFKPGNYATTVNITNTTLAPETVSVYAMVTTGISAIPSVRAPVVSQVVPGLLGLGAGFGTNFEVDCQDIADAFAAIGLPPDGSLFEGNLFIFPNSGAASVQVDAVVTAESQNAEDTAVGIGLGLGMSIDVERCAAVEIDISSLGDGGMPMLMERMVTEVTPTLP